MSKNQEVEFAIAEGQEKNLEIPNYIPLVEAVKIGNMEMVSF